MSFQFACPRRHTPKIKSLVLLCLLGLLAGSQAGVLRAATYTVGPGGDFTKLEDAINGNTYGPGDILELSAGTFTVGAMLKPLGSGAAGNPIIVRGQGMGVTVVDGSALDNSKALWDVEQNNRFWTFEDMTVSGMRGAQTNARGFFLVGCEDVVLQRIEITDCWNGIMSASNAQRVTVQYCDIHHCGGVQGPAHNIYMNSGSDFLIQYNWLHDSQHGICYKDRTSNLTFQYNWVENGDIQGYEISLAGGGVDHGETLLLGNVIIKSEGSSQQTHFVRFEDGRNGDLTMIHNTLVGRNNNVVVSSIANTTTLHNNIFHGGGSIWTSGTLTGNNNWIEQGISVPSGLQGTLSGTSPGFVNLASHDLQLSGSSPCIDAGASVSPQPVSQWQSFGSMAPRSVAGQGPDIGAYEADVPANTPIQQSGWGHMKMMFRGSHR